MKKFLKILTINMILIISLLFLTEIFLFFCEYKNQQEIVIKNNFDTTNNELFRYMITHYYFPSNLGIEEYRRYTPHNNFQSLQSPILLFGCSYTYGEFLKDNETFSSVLHKYTNKPVFNFGVSGTSPTEILYALKNIELFKNIPAPKYVIYTYIQDHRHRLYSPIYSHLTNYKLSKKDNEYFLKEYQNILPQNTFIYRKLKEIYYINHISKSKKDYILMKTYIKGINKQIENIWGKETSLVILFYENEDEQFLEEIKQLGIKIVLVSSLTKENMQSQEYRIPDDEHPNKKAWEVIVPALVKELNL